MVILQEKCGFQSLFRDFFVLLRLADFPYLAVRWKGESFQSLFRDFFVLRDVYRIRLDFRVRHLFQSLFRDFFVLLYEAATVSFEFDYAFNPFLGISLFYDS